MMSKTLKKSRHSVHKSRNSNTLNRTSTTHGKNQFMGDNTIIGHYDLVETFKYNMSSLDYTVYILPKEDPSIIPMSFITRPGVCSTFKSASEVTDSAPLQQNNSNQFLQLVKDENLEDDVSPNDENAAQRYVDLFNE